MTDIKRCFAYNINGTRCDHPAGHPGHHAITVTWTDDECFTPGQPTIVKQAKQATPPEMPQIAEVKPESCVACQHKHKGGPCKCGCYEQIS